MKIKVRFANPQKQYQDHRDEFINSFDSVLSKGDVVMRKDLEEFENKIANFVKVKYAIGVNSGTSAIYLGLRAAGVKEKDEVITVAHTFIASISTSYLLSANPVLVDIGEDFNIDKRIIEKAITPKTKVILPVHLNGRLCDMEVIEDISKRKGLPIVEDAAQSLGGKFTMKNGEVKMAGSFGLAGCFSLYFAKGLGGWGNNGILTTNDTEVMEKVRLMRYNGEDREKRHFYYHSHNLLMDNLQAALLNVKFKYFPEWLKRRREIAKMYDKGLSNVSEIKVPFFGDNRFFDVYTNYVIRAERREELKKYLEEQGVETLVSWPSPTYREPVFTDKKFSEGFPFPRLVSLKGESKELPETERACREVLSLPMYPELKNEEVKYTIEKIKEFYKKND